MNTSSVPAAKKPNIVFILGDNVGQKEYPRSNANPSWKIGTRGASRARFCSAQQIHQAIHLSSTPLPNRIDPKYLIAAHPTPRVCDELRDGLTI
jgi:hypothetical protein